jgi:hypothetical protein
MKSMVSPRESMARYKYVQTPPDANISLVDQPGTRGLPEVSANSIAQFRGVPEDPTCDGGMIHAESTFYHQLFHIAPA